MKLRFHRRQKSSPRLQQAMNIEIVHKDGTTTEVPIVGLPRTDGTTEWYSVEDVIIHPGESVQGSGPHGLVLGPGDSLTVRVCPDELWE